MEQATIRPVRADGGPERMDLTSAEPLAKVVWPVQRYPVFWSNSEKRSAAY